MQTTTSEHALYFNTNARAFYEDNRRLELTLTEIRVLRQLVINFPLVAPRNKIMLSAWPNTIVSPRTVDVHINRLRKRLRHHQILCINRIGYMIEQNQEDGE